MISLLTGQVAHVGLDSAVIDVSGVGYQVQATPASLGAWRHGQQVSVHTTMVVREDSMTLYGFAHSSERDTFVSLTSVSGVGPKLALAMLAVLSPDDLKNSVAVGDEKALTRVPGIGPKVAKRLLLELNGKLGAPENTVAAPAVPAASQDSDVIAALVGLGWQEKVAADAVAAVSDQGNPAQGAVLRRALRHLGGGRS